MPRQKKTPVTPAATSGKAPAGSSRAAQRTPSPVTPSHTAPRRAPRRAAIALREATKSLAKSYLQGTEEEQTDLGSEGCEDTALDQSDVESEGCEDTTHDRTDVASKASDDAYCSEDDGSSDEEGDELGLSLNDEYLACSDDEEEEDEDEDEDKEDKNDEGVEDVEDVEDDKDDKDENNDGVKDAEDDDNNDNETATSGTRKRLRTGEKPRHASLKKQKTQSVEPPERLYADKWVEDCNRKYPVSEDNADMANFRQKMQRVLDVLTSWAKPIWESPARVEWLKQAKEDREMAPGFFKVFATKEPHELLKLLLAGMPNKTQEILGKRDLKTIDLLGLPVADGYIKHRLTYLNVPTRGADAKVYGLL